MPGNGTEPKAFSTAFAITLGVVVLVASGAFIWFANIFNLKVVLGDDAAKADPRAALAAAIIGPVFGLAVVLVAIGLWMTIVEWRAAFKATVPQGGDVSAAGVGATIKAIVEALKDLSGSKLVLISGVVLVVTVGWIAGAAVPETASPTPSATPSSTSGSSPSPSATP